MTAINIPDIYGRWYLINFDLVKLIGVSDNDKKWRFNGCVYRPV